jgi:hypothetical protein
MGCTLRAGHMYAFMIDDMKSIPPDGAAVIRDAMCSAGVETYTCPSRTLLSKS